MATIAAKAFSTAIRVNASSTLQVAKAGQSTSGATEISARAGTVTDSFQSASLVPDFAAGVRPSLSSAIQQALLAQRLESNTNSSESNSVSEYANQIRSRIAEGEFKQGRVEQAISKAESRNRFFENLQDKDSQKRVNFLAALQRTEAQKAENAAVLSRADARNDFSKAVVEASEKKDLQNQIYQLEAEAA